MKKSLSAPSLPALSTTPRLPRPVSTQALHTIVSDINLANELEIVSHSTAYNVGMCLLQYGIPKDASHIAPDLAACIATPSEDVRPRQIQPAPELASMTDMDIERRGLLLSRVRRARRNSSNASK